ncbi:hypothetical protein HK25_00970 [Acetobacter sp. DsW_059]|nr:hypothetical protein HK25_00970 [Acetobacter sp. DsW_059]
MPETVLPENCHIFNRIFFHFVNIDLQIKIKYSDHILIFYFYFKKPYKIIHKKNQIFSENVIFL